MKKLMEISCKIRRKSFSWIELLIFIIKTINRFDIRTMSPKDWYHIAGLTLFLFRVFSFKATAKQFSEELQTGTGALFTSYTRFPVPQTLFGYDDLYLALWFSAFGND